MSTQEVTLDLEVARSGDASAQKSFRVRLPGPKSRVLDALLAIRRTQDASLGFRYACRVGMCGACAIRVDGREVLACQLAVGALEGRKTRLEPLRGFPVQRDLMVDMGPLFESYRAAGAALVPREASRRDIPCIVPDEPTRAGIEAQNGCITCGACMSAAAAAGPSLGAAALNRVVMLAQDGKDALGGQRLAQVAADPLLGLADAGALDGVCPVGVPLAQGLARLKSLAAR